MNVIVCLYTGCNEHVLLVYICIAQNISAVRYENVNGIVCLYTGCNEHVLLDPFNLFTPKEYLNERRNSGKKKYKVSYKKVIIGKEVCLTTPFKY